MPEQRSAQWYAGTDRNAYIHRAWMRRGLPAHAFDGRPHIAIANTASDLAPCNTHLNEVAESVKQGVWEAGGVPMNLPVVSLGETLVKPTAMLWRNMAAMATEEMLRANPVDGVVLLGGCDKTIPSLLMAAASVDLPAVVVPGGPMLTGTFRGQPLGCGTDVWKLSEQVRAGELPERAFIASESSMIRSRGHCNTMGTASTMACMAEALGTTIPGFAGTPAPSNWSPRGAGQAPCSRRGRSATRSLRSRPSEGPRTRWSTCSPSPAGSTSTYHSTTSTGSAPACPCWSTCSRPGGT
jgi:dihydroxy-acid dehydratase